MGKTIGKVLKVVGAVALTVATFNPGFLAMAGISASAIGIAGAVSAVAGGFLDPPSLGAPMVEQGRILTLRTDSTAPRRILYGMAATGGTLLYREATGGDNKNLHLVIALAGHKSTSLDGFKFGDEVVNFNSSGAAIGKYSGFMNLKFHNGADTQAADASLVSSSSKWTANHKLSGVSYAYIKLVWDHEMFPQGLENTLFTLKGRKLYDPRQDPSNGGSPLGTHNINDENTWDWSDNPVLAMIDYLMGIKVGGKLVAGMGVSSSRIDWANIIGEANICDERVALRGGGDEPRYTANGWIDPNQSHRDNLNALSSSCGGSLVFQSGKWRCYVATQRAAVKARSADDVIGPLSLQAKKSSSAKVNSVRGIFSDPSSDYELKDYPPLQNQSFVLEDGGNELWKDVNLPFTKSVFTAQRLAKIALGRARMEKIVRASFSLAAIQDQAMDTISFSHDRFNLNNQNMVCADWRLAVSQTKSGSEGLVVECTLVEDSAEIYSWASSLDEEVVSQAEKIITPNRRYLDHGKIPGEIKYISQVSGNVFSDKFISFADNTVGFGTASKPDMNATVGAIWKQNIVGEPRSLVELNAVEGGKLSGVEDGAEQTTGKSLSVLINRNANYIENTALKRWSTPRRELGVGSSVASNPLSGSDTGTDAIINIAAHTVYLGDGAGISFNSGSITGKAYSTGYYIYASIATLESGSQTVTYQSTTTKETITKNDDYYYVGVVTTPIASGSSTDGDGGGGGWLP